MSMSKGLPPLKILTKKFLQLMENLDKSEGEVERHYKELLREIGQTELHAGKLQSICKANKREQAMYTAKQAELEASIEQARQDIEARKAELKAAKEVLHQNQQYEVLRHKIMEHPTRAVTQQAIDREQRQSQEAQVEQAKIEQLMERRRKQFSLLFYVLEELQRTSDNTAEELAGIEAPSTAMDVDADAMVP